VQESLIRRVTQSSASSNGITPAAARTITRRHSGSRSITARPDRVAAKNLAPAGSAHRSPVVLT